MKRQIIAYFLIVIAIVTTTFTSCKKKESAVATGTFYMHLHTNIDTSEVDGTELYKDASGRQFSLSVAQFYMSNIRLHNVNGSTYTFPDARIIKTIDSEQYLIGQAPIGTYDKITFDIGLDAATNALAPAGFTANGGVANSDMWYGNAANGYMFMKVQGMADTTAGQTGTNLVHFSYEIGSNSNLRTVTMPTRGTGNYATFPVYTLLAGGTQYLHMVADYGALLSVVNFKTQDSTDSYTINPSLSTIIANNMSNFIRYEE